MRLVQRLALYGGGIFAMSLLASANIDTLNANGALMPLLISWVIFIVAIDHKP